jgi:hypothetical protein
MPEYTTHGAYGTSCTFHPPFATYVSAHVLCSDGKVRKTVRLSQTADTFFSVPCAVKVKGKEVAGYMTQRTFDDDTATAYIFVALSHRKNSHLLPNMSADEYPRPKKRVS